MILDPRQGDVEDDATSTKARSLLAIAGTLLVEVSLPKLLFAWTISLLLPALLLGIAPLAATAWLATVSDHFLRVTEVGAALMLIVILVLGAIVWRPLRRMVEGNFWSLNAIAVQPGYVFCREALRHLTERLFGRDWSAAERGRLRALSSAGAAVILCACALLVVALVWPATRWMATVQDLAAPGRLVTPMLANAVVMVSLYLAVASLVWGGADAGMAQPCDLAAFDRAVPGERTWRVVHLSDIHVVGERYGFRLECGRSGPRGNDRLRRVMARIAELHAVHPLDIILISGDMTDAGRAAEWAEFLDALAQQPTLAGLVVMLPGNHDVNIVDRANPARLDLRFSPGKRLRQIRTLSAMAFAQGERVRVVGDGTGQTPQTLNQALARNSRRIADFANRGGFGRAVRLGGIFDDQFPMIQLPETEDGLGIALLNSNAQTHFSFTNALGMVSAEQRSRLVATIGRYPRARWIVALHHHLVEYPMPGVAFSERIGTALINGSAFVRALKPFADRVVIMHGHRHIDWIGTSGALKIVSAPSPVMNATDAEPTHFYVHTLAGGPGGKSLLAPEQIEIAGGVPVGD